jgi:hypothetical protein
VLVAFTAGVGYAVHSPSNDRIKSQWTLRRPPCRHSSCPPSTAAARRVDPVAHGQTLSGTIAGVVTDDQDQVLPGVTVVLTGRQGSNTQVTDGLGAFRFVGLQPGVYSVRAELQGFRPREQQSIDVAIGATVQLRFALPIGTLQEVVQVTAPSIAVTPPRPPPTRRSRRTCCSVCPSRAPTRP